MSSRVIFAITATQAAALAAIRSGAPLPGRDSQHAPILRALKARGLTDAGGQLTELGAAAEALCARLARPAGSRPVSEPGA